MPRAPRLPRRPVTRIRFVTLTGSEVPEPAPDAVKRAVRAMMDTASTFARGLWYQRAADLDIRGSGAYLQGVQDAEIRILEEIETDAEVGVVFELVNTAPHAGIIEHGHAAFHLPSRINWSGPRVKRGPNGPYLHIPFRHAAFQTDAQLAEKGATMHTRRTMMPADVYHQAKALHYTTKQNVGPIYRDNSDGSRQFLAADKYTRKGKAAQTRLGPRGMAGPGLLVGPDGRATDAWRGPRAVQGRDASGRRLVNPAWQSDRFKGMLKGGSPGHTEYMTIRTITPRSVGWNIPAQQGYGVARQVAYALNGAGGDRFRELLVDAARAAMFAGG